jgi:hypothetical protein
MLAPVVFVVVAFAAACGSVGTTTPTQPPARAAEFKDPRDLLITSQDIARQKTPAAAAILRWWQALQFQDTATATRSYANGVKAKHVRVLERDLAGFITLSQPQVLETQVRGKKARILATIQWTAFKPQGTSVVELPVAFNLVRRPGGWKLADNEFLDYRLELQRAQEQAG